jgi:hypothetical protein
MARQKKIKLSPGARVKQSTVDVAKGKKVLTPAGQRIKSEYMAKKAKRDAAAKSRAQTKAALETKPKQKLMTPNSLRGLRSATHKMVFASKGYHSGVVNHEAGHIQRIKNHLNKIEAHSQHMTGASVEHHELAIDQAHRAYNTLSRKEQGKPHVQSHYERIIQNHRNGIAGAHADHKLNMQHVHDHHVHVFNGIKNHDHAASYAQGLPYNHRGDGFYQAVNRRFEKSKTHLERVFPRPRPIKDHSAQPKKRSLIDRMFGPRVHEDTVSVIKSLAEEKNIDELFISRIMGSKSKRNFNKKNTLGSKTKKRVKQYLGKNLDPTGALVRGKENVAKLKNRVKQQSAKDKKAQDRLNRIQ